MTDSQLLGTVILALFLYDAIKIAGAFAIAVISAFYDAVFKY